MVVYNLRLSKSVENAKFSSRSLDPSLRERFMAGAASLRAERGSADFAAVGRTDATALAPVEGITVVCPCGDDAAFVAFSLFCASIHDRKSHNASVFTGPAV